MDRPLRITIALTACLLAWNSARSAPLGTGFTYQGLYVVGGVPVNGTAELYFSLWDAPTGGNRIGEVQQRPDVEIVDGNFNTIINEEEEFGPDAFVGEARWLEIWVCGTPGCASPEVLTPRQPLTPTPYAAWAGSAPWDGLTGVPAGFADNVDNAGDSLWGNNGSEIFYSNGNVGIGGTAAAVERLLVTGGDTVGTAAFGSASKGPHFSHIHYGPSGDWYIRSAASGGKVILQDIGGNVGIGTPNPAYPLTLNTGAAGYGFIHTDGLIEVGSFINLAGGWLGTRSNHPLHFFTNDSGAKVTLTTDGKLGIGETTPTARLHAIADAVIGEVAIRGDAPSGNGVTGANAIAGFGAVAGVNSAGGGIGVFGVANTGFDSRGVWGQANQGTGVYGASASAQTAESAGVFGRNTAENGSGVIGETNTGENAYGVWGRSTTGYGVFGGGDNVGVAGHSLSVGGVGIRGSGGQYAGYFDGNVLVAGDVEKSGDLITMDHPLDPENKYLQLPSVQSSEMKNILDGTVVTDNEGLTTINLPDWFEAANKDFRYQLTCIGQFSQAIVSKEIENNAFEIMTDKPNVKVSWQVTGIRNDAYAKANPVEVEKIKSEEEKGKYLNPELFGQPKEKGIHYRPEMKVSAKTDQSVK